MKKYLTPIALVLVFSTADAQSNFECGFDSAVNLMNAQDTNWYNYQDMYRQQIQEQLDELEVPEPMGQGGVLNKTEPDVQARFLIPVVVHILHLEADSLPGMQSNITDAQVAHQLEILNRAFRNAAEADTNAVNTGIQFCLATRNIHGDSTSGIVRRAGDNLAYFKMLPGIPTPVDTLFPEDKYMNIYIVYRIISPGGDTTGIKGLGLFPLQYTGNGVIMVYDWFGDEATCGDCLLDENSNGHVMVHEAGHYLGLYHTFQGGCSDSSAATCSGAGDRCCDTPPVAAANRSCTPEVNSCSEENDRPDMLSNYMDYSLQCGSAFTANQATLMHATLLSYRTALIEASNVARAGALGCDYHTALFSASQNMVCDSAWVKFTALDAGRSYHWTILNDNGDTLYYAAGDDTLWYNFNQLGTYDVQLITHTGGDSMAMYCSNLVQVADCGAPLTSAQGNWYFGHYAGLRFTGGGAFRDLGAYGENFKRLFTLNSWEGTVTRSDARGELLFYGGSGLPGNSAFRLYNRLHDTLKGAPLPSYDNGSSVQAGLVIPHPQDTNKYYVFVNEEEDIDSSEGGLHYSIVDMTGDGGLGEVLSAWKDIPVKGNPARPHSADSAAHTAEGMTAIPACNGVDHWLITTDFDQYYLNVFLVHDDTLEWNATYQVPYYTKFRSTLVASPDGSKLACRGGILNFDRATGKITTFANAPQQTHQHCFSPNSQVLYLIVGSVLQQVNLLNNSLQARTVAQTPFGLGFGLQLGPDNKIYIVNDHLDFVSVVNFPNSLISDSDPNACGFQPVGVDLSAMGNEPYGQVGVPNIITAKKVEELPLDFYYVASNCSTVKFTTPIACAASYKWFFDDGDSSLSQNPTHSYSSPDRYNVSLIVDGDTVTKEIKLEINKPDITGNLEVCDTTEIQFYSLFNSDPADEYTWSVVEGGELIQSSQTEAQVLWSGDGIIRVDITGDNGCTGHVKDTVIALPVLDSNTISAGQTFYCGNTNPVITGTIPSGGSGSYTYIWQRSLDSLEWETVEGDTGIDHTQISPQQNMYFRRIVQSSNCTDVSNISMITIGYPTNTLSSHTPTSGDCLHGANGSAVTLTLDSLSYQWQLQEYRTAGKFSSWYTQPQDTNQNLRTTPRPDRIQYKARRIVAYNHCFDTSEQVYVNIPQFTGPPLFDQGICVDTVSGTAVYFAIQGNFPTPTHTVWERKAFDSLNWVVFADTSYTNHSYKTIVSQSNATQGDQYRIGVISHTTGCSDTVYSNAALLRADVLPPVISSSLTNASVNEGALVVYAMVASNTQNATFEWQVKAAGQGFWAPIPGENSSSISFLPTYVCQSGNRYRGIVRNNCGADTTNESLLTVYPLFPSDQYDYWMKDSWRDTAAEPNTFYHDTTATQDLFRSPDIWNCDSLNNCLVHENAEYHAQAPNYVRVKVRNKGPYTTNSNILRVYWTLGSTGEIWERSWVSSDQNRFYNEIDDAFYPKGAEITGSGGYAIPQISPGDSTIITIPWYPPNPAWYYIKENGQFVFSDRVTLCLYSRIESCQEYPYGMTYPEQYGVVITDNTRKNNNIATLNFESFDRLENEMVRTPGIGVGGEQDVTSNVTLHFKPAHTDHFDHWDIDIVLDDSLWKYWQLGGSQGSGFDSVGPGKLHIQGSEPFYLEDIIIPPAVFPSVRLEFTSLDSGSLPTEEFEFYLSRHDPETDAHLGGFIINLDNSSGNMNDPGSQMMSATSLYTPDNAVSAFNWKIYPNPAKTQLQIEYYTGNPEPVHFKIYDILGRNVLNRPSIPRSAGNGHELIDLDTLRTGVYFVHFYNSIHRDTKVVIINDR